MLTQRPYFPVPPSTYKTPDNDPLYQDEAYLAEVAWVKAEAEACGCVCCHTTGLSPMGAAAFDTAAPGIWTDTFTERGLAIAAGWIDSSPLGAHSASENNGFDREVTGLPTTDVERMVRFFEGELSRRGVAVTNMKAPLGWGSFIPKSYLNPAARTVSVDTDGTVTWVGGDARYLYVLDGGSENPGVPPNRDKPDGTVWKLDVDSRAAPIGSGIAYGSTPTDTFQQIPAEGRAPSLEAGQAYYIYVLADVGSPITRCIFE